MFFDIRAINFGLSPALTEHVQRKLTNALDRFDQRVSSVRVRLSDLNGPKGGVDMQCHVQVNLVHSGSVFIHQVHEDIYSAIDGAASRLKRTVRRHINRRRDSKKERRTPVR